MVNQVAHRVGTLGVIGLIVFGSLGLWSSKGPVASAASATPVGTGLAAAAITQITRSNKMKELKLPAGFAHDALYDAPAGATQVFLRGFVSEQSHDVVALRIHRAMLRRGYTFAYPIKVTTPYAVDSMLINAVYLKKGSPDILVQSAAVVGPDGGDIGLYFNHSKAFYFWDHPLLERFLNLLKGHATYVQIFGGQGYYDGRFAISLIAA